MKKLAFFFFITFLFISNLSLSQEKYTYSAGANIFKGFIYMHTQKIGHLITEHPTGFEINVLKQTNGTKYWEQAYKYPQVGYSLIYFNYHNSTIGESFALVPYWGFFLNNRESRFTGKFTLGGGLVFNTRPYDKETNNKNNVLSSRVAYAVRFGLVTNFWITNRLSIAPSLTFTHFSNGALKMPNKGINIPAANIGLEYRITDPAKFKKLDYADAPELDRRLNFNFTVSSGVTETTPEGTGKHPFFTFSFYPDVRLNYKSAVNSGIDVFLNYAIKQDIKYDPDLDTSSNPDFKRVGWAVGHELFLGKMTILTQWGTYIYNPYNSDGMFYQRIGVKYYLTQEKLFLGVNLKTHFATAEMAEWSLGYRL